MRGNFVGISFLSVGLTSAMMAVIDGEALSGPLAGSTLPIVTDAYVSFWFAFSQFFPNPDLWRP